MISHARCKETCLGMLWDDLCHLYVKIVGLLKSNNTDKAIYFEQSRENAQSNVKCTMYPIYIERLHFSVTRLLGWIVHLCLSSSSLNTFSHFYWFSFNHCSICAMQGPFIPWRVCLSYVAVWIVLFNGDSLFFSCSFPRFTMQSCQEYCNHRNSHFLI